jgi:protein CMS1
MVYHKGDDLEDDFMPDETVALSEDEGFGSLVGDQDDVGTLLSADEEEEKAGVKSPSERTKAPSEEKKRKRREKEKERKEKECPRPTS